MWWVFLGILLIAVPASARQPPVPGGRAAAAGATSSSDNAEERLARARQAYLNNDFPATITLARDLLYPEVRLRKEEDVLAARRLLALAYFLDQDRVSAQREFTALLAVQPDFALDPVLDPPQAMAFLEGLKASERQRLDDIERRRRDEAEAAEGRRRDEEARRLHEMEERLRRELKPVTIVRHNRWLNLVPLGFGQFQNGQRGKGAALLASQVALGVTSVSLWSTLQFKYDFGRRLVPLEERTSAQVMQYTHVIVGAAFWSSVAFGIIDGFLNYRPDEILDEPAPSPTRPRTTLAPYVLPGGGAGLSLQGAF